VIQVASCRQAAEALPEFAEGALGPSEREAVESHLVSCEGCRERLRRYQGVQGLIKGALGPNTLSKNFRETTAARLSAVLVPSQAENTAAPEEESEARGGVPFLVRLGGAPWWLVSVSLHALVLLLVGLLALALPGDDDHLVITVTRLEQPPKITEPEDQTQKPISEFEHKVETSKTEDNDIIVPPNLQVELADHFETDNPDKPDLHSASGNPDATSFQQSTDTETGGGGMDGASLDDAIGVGGAGMAGSGGGSGGGFGDGVGTGRGSGTGGFGQRSGSGRKNLVMKNGGGRATEGAVEAALAWLARHQDADGSWKAELYDENKNIRYGGGAGTVKSNTIGVSSLALLAFLGAGHTTKIGKYRENVRRAVAYLVKGQGADGNLGGTGCSISSAYCHHIATLALAEAYAMGKGNRREASFEELNQKPGDDLGKVIEKALALTYKWQDAQPDGGWSYPEYGPLDPTVTGWAVMSLKSAKQAGFEVPVKRLEKAVEALDKITTHTDKKMPYGETLTGYRGKGAIDFNSRGYATTAAGMTAKLFLGVGADDPSVLGAAEYITQADALPQWIFKPDDSRTDYQNIYYWYYGTLSSFQLGGDYWKRWNDSMKKAILPHQRQGGPMDGSPQDVHGSFPPDDVWGAWGGTVYSTSLCCLCLEVYYRYLRVHK